jgi:hypothetical protein
MLHAGRRHILIIKFSKMFVSQVDKVLKIVHVNVTWWNKTASRYQVLKTAE